MNGEIVAITVYVPYRNASRLGEQSSEKGLYMTNAWARNRSLVSYNWTLTAAPVRSDA